VKLEGLTGSGTGFWWEFRAGFSHVRPAWLLARHTVMR
jgi:hypothetical protein